MKQKSFALITVFVMLAAMLAGCSQVQANPDSATSIPAPVSVSVSEAISSEPESIPEPEPFDGFINEANFPDKYFREYTQQYHDLDADNRLSDEEIANVTEISLGDDMSFMQSIEGIEHFSNLEQLYANNSYITELDLSNNPALKDLSCFNSPIATLDISGCTALESPNWI